MDDGFTLKLKRAMRHLRELNDESTSWFQAHRYPAILEPDPDGPYQHRIRLVAKEPVPSDPFALIIGDTLYCLRSCLDNLAYVLNGGKPGGQYIPNDSEFPIFGNETRSSKAVDGAVEFKSTLNTKTKGMSQAARAIVDKFQPYHRGNGYREDPLWILHYLCNIDKHRLVHTVVGAYAGLIVDHDSIDNWGGEWDFWSHWGALKSETVIARFTFKPLEIGREVKVNLKPMVGVAFGDGYVSGRGAFDTLSVIANHIATAVIPELVPHIPRP